jgi:hypothetical protein
MRRSFTLACVFLVGCAPTPWHAGVSDERRVDRQIPDFEDLASKYSRDEPRARPADRATPIGRSGSPARSALVYLPEPAEPTPTADQMEPASGSAAKSSASAAPVPAITLDAPAWAKYQSHALIKLIRERQAQEVGLSTGEWDYECFTDGKLEEFVRRDVPGQATKRLMTEEDFCRILTDVRGMSASERSLLLQCARRCYRPTWAELGRVSKDGQTTAGQRAERLLAEAIADFLEAQLSQPSP